jgi:hypothetical protein
MDCHLALLHGSAAMPARPSHFIAIIFALRAGRAELWWSPRILVGRSFCRKRMSLTPVALMAFALLLREETFDRQRLAALILGIGGLALLFGPTAYQGWSSSANISGRSMLSA